jgi:DNA replication and repair protein RecF
VILKRVALTNHRNWRHGTIEFGLGVTLLWGGNGEGKTNLLESVVLACGGRGIRPSPDAELITWGQQEAAVRALLESSVRGSLDIRLRLGPAGRVLTVNGTARTFTALIGLVGIVYFSLADVNICKGEPAERRRFLDIEIGSISRSYHFNILRYRRILEQRNRALKDIREGRATQQALAVWGQPLAACGVSIMRRRQQFLADLAGPANEASVLLCGCRLSLEYEPGLGAASEGVVGLLGTDEQKARAGFTDALAEATPEDIARGTTTVGPHRDDFAIFSEGVDVRKFGSEGEQRTAALALRLGMRKVLEASLEEPPLLLLDDIMSELDQDRRERLAEMLLQASQAIATCTDMALLAQSLLKSASLVKIQGGQVVGQGLAESTVAT